MIPEINDGVLPAGIHTCIMQEVENIFGRFNQTDKRPPLTESLGRYITDARNSGIASADATAWSEEKGFTEWYLYDLATEQVEEDAAAIIGTIRSEPNTPRQHLVAVKLELADDSSFLHAQCGQDARAPRLRRGETGEPDAVKRIRLP